jgi:hypothetical protein
MHKTTLRFFTVFLGLSTFGLSTTLNAAETNMRPGLWEITTTSDLLWLAGQIPPDQMQSIKDLATEYGFELPQVNKNAATSTVCITPEMAKQNTFPDLYQTQFGCSAKDVTRNGNQYKMHFVCASNQLTGDGVAEGTITSPESFSGKTKFSGTAQGTQPVEAEADISGKWVSTSCGEIAPAQTPVK